MVESVSSVTTELVNQYNRSQGDTFWRWKVHGTGPEHCPMMRINVNGVETLGSVIIVLNGVRFTYECLILHLTTTRASSNQSWSCMCISFDRWYVTSCITIIYVTCVNRYACVCKEVTNAFGQWQVLKITNTPAHEVILLESHFLGLRQQCNATHCFMIVWYADILWAKELDNLGSIQNIVVCITVTIFVITMKMMTTTK